MAASSRRPARPISNLVFFATTPALLFRAMATTGLPTLLAEAERGRADASATLAATARMMARNPIVLAITAGVTCAALDLRLSGALDAALAMLGAATTPAALIAVGAGLAGLRLGDALPESAAIAAAKLIVLPLAVWITATQVLALEPLAVAVATVAAGAILLSTLLAIATVPLVIAGLR